MEVMKIKRDAIARAFFMYFIEKSYTEFNV